MPQQSIKELLSSLIESAESSTNYKKYWMVRTDNGLNYQSFYSKGYIALSLENYPLDIISEAKKFSYSQKNIKNLPFALKSIPETEIFIYYFLSKKGKFCQISFIST